MGSDGPASCVMVTGSEVTAKRATSICHGHEMHEGERLHFEAVYQQGSRLKIAGDDGMIHYRLDHACPQPNSCSSLKTQCGPAALLGSDPSQLQSPCILGTAYIVQGTRRSPLSLQMRRSASV